MTDTMTRPQRSACMSRIRSRNTRPEKLVRRMVHHMGCRFRLKPKKLPGSPDIVLTARRAVIFVHGCFWHRHRDCRFAYMPKSRTEFWRKKFTANIDRDRRAVRQLRKMGWKVLVVWECHISDESRLRRRLSEFLGL